MVGGLGIQVLPMLVMVIVVIIGWFYLSYMVAGRKVYAVGGNEEAARFSGLPVGADQAVGLCHQRSERGTGGDGFAGAIRLDLHAGRDGIRIDGHRRRSRRRRQPHRRPRYGAGRALLGALIIRMIESGIYNPLHWNAQYSQIIIGSAIIVAVAIDRLSEHYRAATCAHRRWLIFIAAGASPRKIFTGDQHDLASFAPLDLRRIHRDRSRRDGAATGNPAHR